VTVVWQNPHLLQERVPLLLLHFAADLIRRQIAGTIALERSNMDSAPAFGVTNQTHQLSEPRLRGLSDAKCQGLSENRDEELERMGTEIGKIQMQWPIRKTFERLIYWWTR